MKRIIGLLCVLILSYWAIKPLLGNGYFPMHDDTQVARVVVMGRALRAGQFPVRWVTDLGYGYGYPIFNFYAPLPYYIGGFWYALGLSGLVATKIMFALGMVLAGVSMYMVISVLFNELAGIVVSLLYIYAPYHAVQLYVRGSIDEMWVLVFLPLILFGIWSIHTKEMEKKGMLIGGLGLSGIILSHTVLGYVSVICIVGLLCVEFAFLKIRSLRPNMVVRFIALLAIGLGVSAFFWLPAILEMHFTNVAGQIGSTANFRDHFVCASQLWTSQWGYGGSVKGCVDGLSFMIGKLHIILGVVSVLVILFGLKHGDTRKNAGYFLIGVTLLFTLLTLEISRPIWEILPMFSYVQYPWRFLAFVAFGLSGLASFLFIIPMPKLIRVIATAALCFIILAYSAKWFVPQRMYFQPAANFETNEAIRFVASKISDEYVPSDFQKPKDVSQIVHDTIPQSSTLHVSTLVDSDTYARFAIVADISQMMQLRRIYFPGWHYWVNGQEMSPEINHSLPSVLVPSGNSIVEMRFENTWVRTVANIISIVTIVCLLFIYGQKTKKTYA